MRVQGSQAANPTNWRPDVQAITKDGRLSSVSKDPATRG